MCLNVGGMIRILGRKCWLIEITFRKGSHFKKAKGNVVYGANKTIPNLHQIGGFKEKKIARVLVD